MKKIHYYTSKQFYSSYFVTAFVTVDQGGLKHTYTHTYVYRIGIL